VRSDKKAPYRFVAAMIGQLFIQALALPLVDKFGHGNSALGWSVTIGLFGAFMVICYLITFGGTRERVLPSPHQKSSLREDLKNVFTCRPWIAMFFLTLFVFAMHVIRGSSTNYLFAYYLDPHATMAFLNKVGFAAVSDGPITGWRALLDSLGLLVRPDGANAASVGLSFFLVVGIFVQIGGVLLSKPLSDRFGKKTVFLVGLSITTLATALVIIVTPSSIGLFFFLFSIFWTIGWGPTIPLLWVMIADVADYSEWTTSRRATGCHRHASARLHRDPLTDFLRFRTLRTRRHRERPSSYTRPYPASNLRRLPPIPPGLRPHCAIRDEEAPESNHLRPFQRPTARDGLRENARRKALRNPLR